MSNQNAPQRKSLFAPAKSAGAGSTARSETFPIRVVSYETSGALHSVIGTRLDTGETVSVSLRDIELKKQSKYTRPTIADFAAPRKVNNDPGTVAGGVLLIEDAQKAAEGVYTSRWVRALSHSPDEAEVMIVTAHSTGLQVTPKGKPYSALTFLHDGNIDHLSQEMVDALKLTASGAVTDMGELKAALTEMVEYGIGAGVRIKAGDDFDALYVSAKKDVASEKVVEDFMNRIPDEMAQAIDAGSVMCEIIPYGVVWAGPATLEIMDKNPTVQNRLARYSDKVISNGKERDVQLFRPTIVAMRLTKPDANGNRGVYVTHVEPLYNRQPVIGLREAVCFAKTEAFAPTPPKPELVSNQPSHEASTDHHIAHDADQGFSAGDDFQHSSSPVSEEDIMGAAAHMGDAQDIGDHGVRASRGRRPIGI